MDTAKHAKAVDVARSYGVNTCVNNCGMVCGGIVLVKNQFGEILLVREFESDKHGLPEATLRYNESNCTVGTKLCARLWKETGYCICMQPDIILTDCPCRHTDTEEYVYCGGLPNEFVIFIYRGFYDRVMYLGFAINIVTPSKPRHGELVAQWCEIGNLRQKNLNKVTRNILLSLNTL